MAQVALAPQTPTKQTKVNISIDHSTILLFYRSDHSTILDLIRNVVIDLLV